MKVTLGKDGLGKTHQDDFPETLKCSKCKGTARIAFVAHEGIDTDDHKGPFVCDIHGNEGKGGYWTHDCCAVAVYICKNCFHINAVYNQG